MEFQQQGKKKISFVFQSAKSMISVVMIVKRFVPMQKLAEPTVIDRWAVVNFSARCDIRSLCRDLIKCGGMKGIVSIVTNFAI